MKDKEVFTLDDFEILERLTSGAIRTFSIHKDVPIISIKKTGIGFGEKAISFLQLSKKSRVVYLKRQDIHYIAILPFDSKINGYVVNNPIKGHASKNLVCCFMAEKRGCPQGHFKLLNPIYVSGIDLYELEPFDI